MATCHSELPRIRDQVGLALHDFLDRQRAVLGGISPDLLPWLDAITALLAGGKRLRAAFCYWGWRAADGEDGPEVHAAAAALELLHASALVHDDLMDGSDTRRGQPSVHRAFAARHAAHGWRGSADAFGAGAAILIGDLLLAWTDQLFHGSGLPAGRAAARAAGARRDARRADLRRSTWTCSARPPGTARSQRAAGGQVQVGQVHDRAPAAARRGAGRAGPAATGDRRGVHRLRHPARRRVPAPRRRARGVR